MLIDLTIKLARCSALQKSTVFQKSKTDFNFEQHYSAGVFYFFGKNKRLSLNLIDATVINRRR